MEKFRKVITYKNYVEVFFDTLPIKVINKFIWTFELIEDIKLVPTTYLKHIEDGIYEIRVKSGSNIYRIFAFFDKAKLVVAINGFQKKSQKTPRAEINKAKKIRLSYEQEKK